MNDVSNSAAANETPLVVPETRLLMIPGGRPNIDEDAQVIAARAAHSNQPIRMRVNLGLFEPESRKQYKFWRGVGWKMEFATLAEVVAFREGLGEFVAGWFDARKQG